MNFNFSEDQILFNDSVCKYLTDQYDFESRQAIVAGEAPFDPSVWRQCTQMGWLHLLFSEEQSEVGGTPVDTISLFEALGKHLVVEPFLETLILFGGVLRRVSPSQVADNIDQLLAGELQGALAHFEANSRGNLSVIATRAEHCQKGYRINGRKSVVYNASGAELLVVSARVAESGNLALFLVHNGIKGLALQTYTTVDGRQAAEVELSDVELEPHQLLAVGEQAMSILESVYDEALLALTAEMVGAMDSLLTTTVEYAEQRKQFGSAIGKFQSLQHQMSDMFMAVELSRSLMYAAAIKLRDGAADARAFIAAAKVKADKCAQQVAHSAVQLHGGIATTDELNVGHYLKRITVITQLFGSTQYHLRRFQQLRAGTRDLVGESA